MIFFCELALLYCALLCCIVVSIIIIPHSKEIICFQFISLPFEVSPQNWNLVNRKTKTFMNLLKKSVFVKCSNSIKMPSGENDDITVSKLEAQHVIYQLCQQKKWNWPKCRTIKRFQTKKSLCWYSFIYRPKMAVLSSKMLLYFCMRC